MLDLKELGWNNFLDAEFESYREAGFDIGRVIIENRDNYLVVTKLGECTAEVTGKLLHNALNDADFPKVGDWVVITLFEEQRKAIIHSILPRKTKFSRKVAGGKTEEQIIATNLDFIFIVQSLDHDFNLRRLERHLVMINEEKINPIIVLNKVDLCKNINERVSQVKAITTEIPIIPVSGRTQAGIEKLKGYLHKALTYAFIGSSGVGKSTLINKLVGEDILKTNDVRLKDSKGRHTTNRRELIVLSGGALLIDTPGMREFQLWKADEGLEETYIEISRLARNCFFKDCRHINEKNCAVLEAVERGEISRDRYESYLKLNRELAHLERKHNKFAYLENKRKIKEIYRAYKKFKKSRQR